jgi:DNA polymerase
VSIIVHRDYECRSVADLKKAGAHAYAQHPSTEILCAVWVIEYGSGVQEVYKRKYPETDDIPEIVRDSIRGGATVAGHNAAFEHAIDTYLTGPRYGWPIPKLEQLDCTMARAAVQAIPLDLDRACRALSLACQKDKEGHRLMLQMCKPRKPRKGEPPGLYWHFDDAKLERLLQYCVADVQAEIALGKALRPLQDMEKPIWILDQIMNNRGVSIDLDYVRTAEAFVIRAAKRADARIREVTGGAVKKVTQLDRLKDWARWTYGVGFPFVEKTRRNGEKYEAEQADKEALEDLIASGDLPQPVSDAFKIRLEAGKASLKKLAKFQVQCSPDGRARGNLQYHAASPGRWGGRGIQLQNLVRKGVTEFEASLQEGRSGWEEAYRDMQDLSDETFELVWGSPFDVVSRMSRGAVVAALGNRLYFGDFSNVEARGAVWAAGQTDQVELFASGGLIYETMASSIFGLSVEEVLELHKTKRDIVPRFCGKETVLGCGYGMGWRAFKRNCKKKGNIILPDEICQKAVGGWREKNYKIAGRDTGLWRLMEDAAKAAIENPGQVFTAGPFSYRVKGRWLQCRLPSGRVLWYRRPSIKATKEDIKEFGRVPPYRWKIHYWGVNGVTKQWEEESTWGGKLLENADQGMCSDFLRKAMLGLEAAGYPMVLSVHDEAIAETPEDFGSVEEFLSIMTELPLWAPGFPLKAEGGTGTRYAKG